MHMKTNEQTKKSVQTPTPLRVSGKRLSGGPRSRRNCEGDSGHAEHVSARLRKCAQRKPNVSYAQAAAKHVESQVTVMRELMRQIQVLQRQNARLEAKIRKIEKNKRESRRAGEGAKRAQLSQKPKPCSLSVPSGTTWTKTRRFLVRLKSGSTHRLLGYALIDGVFTLKLTGLVVSISKVKRMLTGQVKLTSHKSMRAILTGERPLKIDSGVRGRKNGKDQSREVQPKKKLAKMDTKPVVSGQLLEPDVATETAQPRPVGVVPIGTVCPSCEKVVDCKHVPGVGGSGCTELHAGGPSGQPLNVR